MIFPMTTGSDPDSFYNLAKTCSSNFSNCTDAVRPIGIIYYYAMLMRICGNDLTFTYVVLALNIFYVFAVFFIFNKILNPENNIKLTIGLFILVLLNMLCFIPFTMSDPIALFVFCIGMYIILKEVKISVISKKNITLVFVSGALFAVSGLFKQNYFAFGVLFSIIYFIRMSIMDRFIISLRTQLYLVLVFLLGTTFILIQAVNIYVHYKVLGLFVPFPVPNSEPYIQSFGYTHVIDASKDLVPGFYFTQLSEHTNIIFYYSYKLFLGLSRFNLTLCYVDRPTLNNVITLSSIDYVITILALALLSIFCILNKNKNTELIMMLSGVVIALFIAITFHVEIRYYMLPRILIYSVILRNIFYYKT